MIYSLSVFTSLALAHGPVAQQAIVAVEKATQLFLKTEKMVVAEKFKSANVVKTGEEKFEVQIALMDSSDIYTYDCGLYEKDKPVFWGCKARKK